MAPSISAVGNADQPSQRVALVSCVGDKRDRALPARELYCSDWFLKARAAAEAQAHKWWILSAEYGLVGPEEVIAPYERTLNRMRAGERRAWAEDVYATLRSRLGRNDEVCVLAGGRYRELLVLWLERDGFLVRTPMAHLRIGEQLQWLGRAASGSVSLF